jgi:hypothetical protein
MDFDETALSPILCTRLDERNEVGVTSHIVPEYCVLCRLWSESVGPPMMEMGGGGKPDNWGDPNFICTLCD